MARPIFKSPMFWGGVGLLAVGVGTALYRRRAQLLGDAHAGPAPVLVPRNPARMPRPVEVRKDGGITSSLYVNDKMSIDERLKLIQARVWDGIRDGRIRRLALQITAGCGRDDGECEARRIFDAVKAKVRYTGDIGPVMHPDGHVDAIDVYQKPWLTWEMGGGDCDDAVGVVGSLLASIGHTVRLRVSGPSKFSDFQHIYPVTGLPKDGPRVWKAVDITLPWRAQLGSEARYAKARDYFIREVAA